MVKRSYQFRFYPTRQQHEQLAIEFGKARFVWNRSLARAQRVLSRRKKGSGRRIQQRIRVARIHLKVKDSRSDFLHKLSSKLINGNQVIGIEDLCVKGCTAVGCRSPSLIRVWAS